MLLWWDRTAAGRCGSFCWGAWRTLWCGRRRVRCWCCERTRVRRLQGEAGTLAGAPNNGGTERPGQFGWDDSSLFLLDGKTHWWDRAASKFVDKSKTKSEVHG